jgi:hypothetical protein
VVVTEIKKPEDMNYNGTIDCWGNVIMDTIIISIELLPEIPALRF